MIRMFRPLPRIPDHESSQRDLDDAIEYIEHPSPGSGASGDFGREKGRWRTEDRQAAKHKCLVSGRFPSLTRVTGHASAADEWLLSADAPEPLVFKTRRTSSVVAPSLRLVCQSTPPLVTVPARRSPSNVPPGTTPTRRLTPGVSPTTR